MAMRIGFQTIVWGPRVRDLKYMLDVIEAAGYEGVEFFQRPEVIQSVADLPKLLEEHHLKLIGLSGGSLGERMNFCRNLGICPDYLYVDRWDEPEACEAMDAGFTLGLHPHAHMPVGNLADALRILAEHPLREYPRLKFIPDTAHLTVTHDDPVDAIRKTKERIVAVHLKDWSPEFGRFSFRYARGFAELGAGSVDLNAILSVLRDMDYSGWLVVERDYTLTDPDTSTLASAKWLSKRRIPTRPRVRKSVRTGLRASEGRETCQRKREVLFSRQIARARLQDISRWYDNIAVAFRKLIPCKLVEVWRSVPDQNVMTLLAIKPDILPSRHNTPTPPETLIENRDDVLSGTTMERRAITHFDLTLDENARRFEHPGLLRQLSLNRMVSIPIFNPWNFNHVKLILNLCPSDGETIPNDDELFRASANVAFALDAALEDICSASATKVNFEASKCGGLEDFLSSLLELVRRALNCQGVGIFLANESGDRLELRASTGTTWAVPHDERYYGKGEGLTGWVWETGNTFLTLTARSESRCKAKSREGIESQEHDDCLFAPLSKPTGEVFGVVRCRRKRAARRVGEFEKVLIFSDDDASVLEAIVQAAVPHFDALIAQEQREKALMDMRTSLRVLGHEADQLNFGLEELRTRYLSSAKRLRQLEEQKAEDICRDIEGYFKQLDFLFKQAAMVVGELPNLQKSEFWAYRELLFKWQDIYRLEVRIKNLTFDITKTWAGDPWRPPIYADQTLLEQLVYNLVSNAVKYCYPGTKIQIDCKKSDLGRKSPHILTVIDYGREFKCRNLFAPYTRGENVEGIEGIGIGMYNAKRIADAHDAQFTYQCERISDFNVPLMEPYVKRQFDGKDELLTGKLRQELARLEKSGQYEGIVNPSKFVPGLSLYQTEEYELARLIMKPTWKVTFRVILPAKGT